MKRFQRVSAGGGDHESNLCNTTPLEGKSHVRVRVIYFSYFALGPPVVAYRTVQLLLALCTAWHEEVTVESLLTDTYLLRTVHLLPKRPKSI